MAPVTVTRRTIHPAWRAPNFVFITATPVEVGPQAPGRGDAYTGISGWGAAKKVVALGGRCSLAVAATTDPPTTRKVAPQAGRVTAGLFGTAIPVKSVVAGSFTHITVTRDYDLATGDAPTGVVYFTLSAWLVNNLVTVVPAPAPAALDSIGRISIDLVANTDPGTAPAGSYYTVREVILGQPERSYKVRVPINAGLSVDLATLPVIP